MDITIRNAVKEDCASMMKLIHELAVYEKAPEAVTVDFNHFVESGFGPHPVWYAFVATAPLPSPRSVAKGFEKNEATDALFGNNEKAEGENLVPCSEILNRPSTPIAIGGRWTEDEVVGFALYYIRYSTWKGQRLYLEDLLVTEELRGKGIGKLLFDQLIEECKEKNYSGMVWQVLDWNEPAINFYKKYNADMDGAWLNCSLNF